MRGSERGRAVGTQLRSAVAAAPPALRVRCSRRNLCIERGIGVDFFLEKVEMRCSGSPREVVEKPSLEVFWSCGDVALRDVVW